ncbi:YrhB domain-containing protein [Dactylosporangium sp. AC04546]|uniref:YrhB domain-containing protein n=1 Tax=Dactylosporangium sp. AC04546 TaxID=2862460 RepID=UPI001EDF63F0|nr:YrhB domain-containing protein [Dactylosporangium sp. AC04546]WVK78573.1 YrhB domain-containing protein [Dactylosporangium sp. AC04546]
MTTRQRAVELVEALLADLRRQQPTLPELAVFRVEEHVFGWLVYWQSADYLRSRDFGKMLIGHGPYLVDVQDGSIHHIPVTTHVAEDWEAAYLEHVRGVQPPDPLLTTIRDLLPRDGAMAALRHLRRQAPQLGLQEAKAYVDAVRNGDEPAEDLLNRTRSRSVLSIETLAGPAT